MDKTFQISDIARFFQIPASTLRYWEEKGILSPQKDRWNQYRKYTVADLMTISDILFYKSLDLPLKQIRTVEQLSPAEHKDLLESKVRQLEIQKQELEHKLQKLHSHLFVIDSLQYLQQNPFTEAAIDAECIVPFELIEARKLRQYIENPYLYSRVQHSDHPEKEQRGLVITYEQAKNLPKHEKLWVKNDSRYVVCLLKEEIVDGFPNNLTELLKQVQERYQTGYIISRFLLCATENSRLYDFYKTYIEITGTVN